MIMSQKVRQITGCEPLTKYFKPISKQRYEAEQAYQAVLDEEKAEERRTIIQNRINQREEDHNWSTEAIHSSVGKSWNHVLEDYS